MNITLRLSNGRKIALASGTKIHAADLPGLHSARSGGPVAMVSSHPTDPSIRGLQNLSQQSWRAHTANGDSVEVKPSKNVRLAPGTRINFGPINGDIQFAGGGARSKTWLWASLGVAAALIVAAAGWYFFQHRADGPNWQPRTASTNESVRPQPENAQVAIQPQKASQEQSNTGAAKQPSLRAQRGRVATRQSVSSGVYALQDRINFDCLDGATVDPKSGAISLFGHWEIPNQHLWIPYYDYLATALECKAPTFGLYWTQSSYPDVDRVLNAGGDAILESVRKFFDDHGRLTFGGAWLLQQTGVPVAQFMDHHTVLARMLSATGRPKTAETVARLGAWLSSEDNKEEITMALYKSLSVDASFREMQEKWSAGKASEDQLKDQFYPQFFAALGKALDSKRNYGDLYKEARRSGRSSSEAFRYAQSDLTKDLQALFLKATDQLAQNLEVLVPVSVVTSATGGVVPRVNPVFKDLPPRSLLARTAFAADYIFKQVGCAPGLKNKIPTYQTLFEFDRAHQNSKKSGYERCWLSPGKFELDQSPDKNTVRFESATVAVNVRKRSADDKTDVRDPVAEEYGAQLTSQYDALAREIPILRDLRESMKVIALARWIQKRGLHVDMPREGRSEWSPPAEVPGIIHTVLSIHDGKVVASSAAEGGVDLSKNPTIRDAVAEKPRNDSTATVPTAGTNLLKAWQSESEELHDAVAGKSPLTKQQLENNYTNASTPEDKARAAIELWRAGGGDKWYMQAFKDNPNAAAEAIRGPADPAFARYDSRLEQIPNSNAPQAPDALQPRPPNTVNSPEATVRPPPNQPRSVPRGPPLPNMNVPDAENPPPGSNPPQAPVPPSGNPPAPGGQVPSQRLPGLPGIYLHGQAPPGGNPPVPGAPPQAQVPPGSNPPSSNRPSSNPPAPGAPPQAPQNPPGQPPGSSNLPPTRNLPNVPNVPAGGPNFDGLGPHPPTDINQPAPPNPNLPSAQVPQAQPGQQAAPSVKLIPFDWSKTSLPPSIDAQNDPTMAQTQAQQIVNQMRALRMHQLPPPSIPFISQHFLDTHPDVAPEVTKFMQKWEEQAQNYGRTVDSDPNAAEQMKHDMEEETKKFKKKLTKKNPDLRDDSANWDIIVEDEDATTQP